MYLLYVPAPAYLPVKCTCFVYLLMYLLTYLSITLLVMQMFTCLLYLCSCTCFCTCSLYSWSRKYSCTCFTYLLMHVLTYLLITSANKHIHTPVHVKLLILIHILVYLLMQHLRTQIKFRAMPSPHLQAGVDRLYLPPSAIPPCQIYTFLSYPAAFGDVHCTGGRQLSPCFPC